MSPSPPEFAGVALGAAVDAGRGSTWRTAARLQVRRHLAGALRHPSPRVRADAVAVLGERGIAAHSRRLLELACTEADDTVIRELLAVVRRTQWEPADRRALLELRMWARHLSAGPEQVSAVEDSPVHGPAAAASPVRGPAVPGPATEPVPAGLESLSVRRRLSLSNAVSPLAGRLADVLGEAVTIVRTGPGGQGSTQFDNQQAGDGVIVR